MMERVLGHLMDNPQGQRSMSDARIVQEPSTRTDVSPSSGGNRETARVATGKSQ